MPRANAGSFSGKREKLTCRPWNGLLESGVDTLGSCRMQAFETAPGVDIVGNPFRGCPLGPADNAKQMVQGVRFHEQVGAQSLPPHEPPDSDKQVAQKHPKLRLIDSSARADCSPAGLTKSLERPLQRYPLEEHSESVDPSAGKLLGGEDGEFQQMTARVENFQPMLGLTKGESYPGLVRNPGEVGSELLVPACRNDDEEVMIRPPVGLDPIPRHRTEGDQPENFFPLQESGFQGFGQSVKLVLFHCGHHIRFLEDLSVNKSAWAEPFAP